MTTSSGPSSELVERQGIRLVSVALTDCSFKVSGRSCFIGAFCELLAGDVDLMVEGALGVFPGSNSERSGRDAPSMTRHTNATNGQRDVRLSLLAPAPRPCPAIWLPPPLWGRDVDPWTPTTLPRDPWITRPGSCGGRPGQTKTEFVVRFIGVVPVTVRRSSVLGFVVPRAAANNTAVGSCLRTPGKHDATEYLCPQCLAVGVQRMAHPASDTRGDAVQACPACSIGTRHSP